MQLNLSVPIFKFLYTKKMYLKGYVYYNLEFYNEKMTLKSKNILSGE